MNPKGRHLISTGVLFSALAFSGATFAQSSSTTNTATPAGSAMSDSTQASSNAHRTQAGTQANDKAGNSVSANAITEAHPMRASKIIGADVENAKGEEIGEIKDMMVDTRNERVRYVVLSHGGVLGIGDKLFAYPMSMVHAKSGDSNKLVMNVNEEKLENAPGFDKDKWPDFAGNDKYGAEVDKYYGASSRHDGEQAGRLVRASDLIGKNFDDTKGKDAGEIEDLIVNSNNGNIEYAVVDFDDSWAKKTDGKLVAIPLSNITVSGDKNDKLVIQTSPDRIDMSHAFASNHWPDFRDPAWAQQSSAAQSQSSSTAPTSQRSSASPRS
ncbi:MAG: PRC-barrel domain-containing protein [Burkholderiaceae bacterium]|nr:PRC-barrel domain-containing protein [Burkholderiaceae bacterium]